MSAAAHDPGGKVRLALAADIVGDATFSACGRYRHRLSRWWGEGIRVVDDDLCPVTGIRLNHVDPASTPFALWIGMNPSTAEAFVDDPTVRREVGYTRDRLGLRGYVKTNVMDYRATDPKALRAPGVIPCSLSNSTHITELAGKAEIVVAAWGALPKALRHHAEYVRQMLQHDGIQLWSLGRTKDGSPRHPLYVRGDTALERWPA